MSITTFPAPASPSPQRTFLGHPIGLYVLFFTEMWERFSYYGMRALLMLYMINYFKWAQKDASTIYKVYTSFVYVTPILGGYLADRVLGNKRAVIIGAILMAIGHFLMAFEQLPIFLSALVFLIFGNGFFKPNMSTQVGRLYPANDGRRDGAYTIFYMGINLGAFLSPLLCGWLAANTVGGYHTGFTMAGIGMVCGLLIYVLGQPLVREIDTQVPAASGSEPASAASERAKSTAIAESPSTGNVTRPLTEAEAERVPSVLGVLSEAAPYLLVIAGVLIAIAGVVLTAFDVLAMNGKEVRFALGLDNSVMVLIVGICSVLMGFVAKQVVAGMRDRVMAILTLGVFVVFFWAAFEQAGNVLNVWADKNTERYLTKAPPPESVIPEVIEDAPKVEEPGQSGASDGVLSKFVTMFNLKPKPAGEADSGWITWIKNSINPVPAEWFQSINALAIFVFAPFFAWMWVALDRRGWQPSIPLKMTIGLVMMSASMAIMMAAAKQEDRLTTVDVKDAALPDGIALTPDSELAKKDSKGNLEPFHARRISLVPDKSNPKLRIWGVLPDNERDNIIGASAPESFRDKLKELKEAAKKIEKKGDSATVALDVVPPGFDMKFAGLKKSVVRYDESAHTLTAYQALQEKETKALLVAAGAPAFRASIHELFVQSNAFRVSPLWLLWSYIFATFGELCLSPVGLSMVSKLAPAKYSTMLMGMWMLTSAFGNFAAGWLGEIWGTIPPVQFFMLATVVLGAAAVVLLVVVRLVVHMMHGVN
jgi:dipeptide/tripeptide permease